MILKIKTEPTVEPVTIDETKLHCHLDDVDMRGVIDDVLLAAYIKAARQYIEDLCGPLITQTWLQYQDNFPSGDHLLIGKPRLQSVTSLKYTDLDGTQATFSATKYTVSTQDEFRPEIVVLEDEDWPSDQLFNTNPIEIEFICGYGDATTDIPEPIRLAILLLVSNWYENREPVFTGVNTVQQLPFAVDALLANYRTWGYGA